MTCHKYELWGNNSFPGSSGSAPALETQDAATLSWLVPQDPTLPHAGLSVCQGHKGVVKALLYVVKFFLYWFKFDFFHS